MTKHIKIGDCLFRKIDPDDVSVVRVMGDDYTPYRMARLSYDGGDETPSEEKLRDFTKKLLENGHMVPFEHCAITYRIKAPIFVLRQILRYRTAIVSEKSLRYCDASPEFCVPDFDDEGLKDYTTACCNAYQAYLASVAKGMRKEQARGVLPLCTFSECYFTINLRNLFHLLDQRTDISHAQIETVHTAKSMEFGAGGYFPKIMYCRLEVNAIRSLNEGIVERFLEQNKESQ